MDGTAYAIEFSSPINPSALRSTSNVQIQVQAGYPLWERARAFADRSVEYLAAGWARYRARGELKADLIEARLHLASAGIGLFTGHEVLQARRELVASLRYLEKAAEKTQQQNADQIHAKQIDAMRSAVKDPGTDAITAKQAGYLALEHQMSDLIHSL